MGYFPGDRPQAWGEAPGLRLRGAALENVDMTRFLAVVVRNGVISGPLGGKTGLMRDTHWPA